MSEKREEVIQGCFDLIMSRLPEYERGELIEALHTLKNAALSAPQPSSDPVAWRWRFKDGHHWLVESTNPPHAELDRIIVEPLYTQPSSERAEPLRGDQLDVRGNLFGLRFVDGCSDGCVELYVEDDEWWHHKMTFDRRWLNDLARVAALPQPSGKDK